MWMSMALGAAGGCDSGRMVVDVPTDEVDPSDTDLPDDGNETGLPAGALPDAPPASPCELPGRGGPLDETLFQRLVANPWGYALQPGRTFPRDPAHGLALWADGTYTWVQQDDVLYRREWGWWDFRAIDEVSGLLLLGGDAAVSFNIEDNVLRLLAESQALLAAEAGLDDPPRGQRDDLRWVGPPSDWCEVTEHPMRAANRWLQRPDVVQVEPNGRGTLADGGCEASGRMSMFTYSPIQGGDHTVSWTTIGRPACSRDWLAFDEVTNRTSDGDGVWLFDHRYRRDTGPMPTRLVDSRYASWEVVGELTGEARQGGSVHLALRVGPSGATGPLSGSRLVVSTQPLERVEGNLIARGAPAIHQESDVAWRLGRGETGEVDITLELPESEAVDVILSLDNSRWRQRLLLSAGR